MNNESEEAIMILIVLQVVVAIFFMFRNITAASPRLHDHVFGRRCLIYGVRLELVFAPTKHPQPHEDRPCLLLFFEKEAERLTVLYINQRIVAAGP